ncbi:LuxR C-terminal-related transcriptional regulator [Catellatospora aurea]|uniref:LuxR C-terminal-related transcriptional regulator n=1 Tax=Catellatospora aurea TaxID=1337874 RepID=A0ABW2GNZ9_9ACTN
MRVALDELAALGAASPDGPAGGDDRTWTGHDPAQVVAVLRDRHQRSMLAQHRLQLRLTRIAHPPAVGDLSRLPRDEVHRLDGMVRTRARLSTVLQSAHHETLTMNPEPAFNTAELKESSQQMRKVSARGGVTRLILGIPASAGDDSAWYSAESRARGARYRELPTMPMKLFVFDRRSAFIVVDPADRSKGYWEITAAQAVSDLIAMFYQHWEMSKPPRMWMPPKGLSPRESAIVVLLADGHTDAAITTRLDLSMRTIAYTVAGLMERYQVTNRFQLGLRLGAEAAQQAAASAAPPPDTPHQPTR